MRPAGGRVVRDNRPQASRRPSAGRSESLAPSSELGGKILGCCCRFDEWSTPTSRQCVKGFQLKYNCTAFDSSLARVESGLARIRLLVDHDEELVLGSTDDDLVVWVEDEAILFELTPRSQKSRLWVNTIKAMNSSYGASIGGDLVEAICPPGRTIRSAPAMVATEFRLKEISLLPLERAACPATWVKWVP